MIALSSKDVALFGFGWLIQQDNRCRKACPRLYRCAFGKRMATAEMCLNVRGEPVAATLVLNIRPRTRQRRLICHELALGLAEFSFVSLVAQHLRGITHTMADALSRRAQPMSSVTLASFLKEATPVFPPVLEAAYCRTTTDLVMPARDLKFSLHHRNTHV